MHEFQADRTRVLLGDRQTGKTTALIEWARQDPKRLIVCPTQGRVDSLIGQAPDLRGRVFSSGGAVQHLRGHATGGHLAVDDLLDYVYADLGVMPAIVTMDGKPVTPVPPEPDPDTPVGLQLEAARAITDENARLRQQVGVLIELLQDDRKITCDGRCLTGHDVGVPFSSVAYPDPECSLHGDRETQMRALFGVNA